MNSRNSLTLNKYSNMEAPKKGNLNLNITMQQACLSSNNNQRMYLNPKASVRKLIKSHTLMGLIFEKNQFEANLV